MRAQVAGGLLLWLTFGAIVAEGGAALGRRPLPASAPAVARDVMRHLAPLRDRFGRRTFVGTAYDGTTMTIRVDPRAWPASETDRFVAQRTAEAETLRTLRDDREPLPRDGVTLVFSDPDGREIDRFEGVRFSAARFATSECR